MSGNPLGLRCSPEAIRRTVPAKTAKSLCFELRRGCRSKNGITLVSRSFRIADDEHQTGVAVAMVLSDPSTAESIAYQVEDLTSIAILADMEFRNELPAGSRTRIPLDGDVE